METAGHTFEPCRKGAHEACTGAYLTTDGGRMVCGCDCHQPSLFPVVSKQKELFEVNQ
jgi:hypothetical protein